MSLEAAQLKVGHLVAAADLSLKQFYVVKIDTAGKWAVAGAGEGQGILQGTPVADEAADVCVLGVSKGVAGAAITKGDYVTSDASGKLKTAVKGKTDTSDAGAAADPLLGSNVLGIALTSAAADLEVISVMILNQGSVPTTAS